MSREFTPETERQRLQFLVRKTFLLTSFLLKTSWPLPSPLCCLLGCCCGGVLDPRAAPWLGPAVGTCPSQTAPWDGKRHWDAGSWHGSILWLAEPWFAVGSVWGSVTVSLAQLGHGEPRLLAWAGLERLHGATLVHLVLLLSREQGASPAWAAVTWRRGALLPPSTVLPFTVRAAAVLLLSPGFFPGCSLKSGS